VLTGPWATQTLADLMTGMYSTVATLAALAHRPPTLGQHTDDVLSTLGGMSAAEIAALRMDRVL
jgi:crotonobetainyl-CoA:carnitine CoA-transferase CaiB-like acyl-CoA transferase